jgi:hypothetical protein
VLSINCHTLHYFPSPLKSLSILLVRVFSQGFQQALVNHFTA